MEQHISLKTQYCNHALLHCQPTPNGQCDRETIKLRRPVPPANGNCICFLKIFLRAKNWSLIRAGGSCSVRRPVEKPASASRRMWRSRHKCTPPPSVKLVETSRIPKRLARRSFIQQLKSQTIRLFQMQPPATLAGNHQLQPYNLPHKSTHVKLSGRSLMPVVQRLHLLGRFPGCNALCQIGSASCSHNNPFFF